MLYAEENVMLLVLLPHSSEGEQLLEAASDAISELICDPDTWSAAPDMRSDHTGGVPFVLESLDAVGEQRIHSCDDPYWHPVESFASLRR